MRNIVIHLCLVLSLCSAGTSDAAQLKLRGFEVWVQRSADSPAEQVAEFAVEPVDAIEFTAFDLQYQQEMKFRGVELLPLIAPIAAREQLDLALLRFQNGIVIPLPLHDERVARRLLPRIAGAYFEDAWSSDFPSISRKDPIYNDARPIEFFGSKLVVKSGWHPMMTKTALAHWHPWLFANTLLSVELTRASAYYDAFPHGRSTEGQAGFVVFRQNCQFCHAVGEHGAHYGWDFLTPIPVTQYRGSARSLYYHIRYRDADAPARGLLMPPLRSVSKEEVDQLYRWLEELAAP